jgi:uncharacterized protein (TIGR03435 family)
MRTRLCVNLLGCLSIFGLLQICPLVTAAAAAQPAFAVASIRPSGASVQFEHDGKTETTPGSLRMRDVTVATCIKWAYGVQDSQIAGPESLLSQHYDLMAKADGPANDEQMKLMLRTLLADRFKLTFHHEDKELRSFAMVLAKSGNKMHEARPDETMSRENTNISTVAKAITMKQFADFIAGPLRFPVVDQTGLTGRYDFVLDFTAYLPTDNRERRPEDFTDVINAAMQGELGLKLEPKKEMVDVMVVDHVEKPSEN